MALAMLRVVRGLSHSRFYMSNKFFFELHDCLKYAEIFTDGAVDCLHP